MVSSIRFLGQVKEVLGRFAMMLSHQSTFCLPRQVLGRKEGHLKDIGLFEAEAELVGKPLQIVASDFKSGADQYLYFSAGIVFCCIGQNFQNSQTDK